MTNDKRKMLPVVANGFDRTTTHRFFTLRSLFLALGLLVNKRVVFFVAPHEVVGRGVAANVAIDAGGVYVKSAADVFLHFVVSIGHFKSAVYAPLRLRMRHLFRNNQPIKLFTG